ncbi:MAG TPA: hypothetical protein VNA16_06510 [Abditibacteriaceae bacterium]|nr:hypothetical protein [Abditibacteriaceae bacterium]
MESSGNPALALLGFWMTMQLVATLALLLGGIYALFCLGRAASGLDRLASAVEEWVSRQSRAAGSTPAPPGASSFEEFVEHRVPAATPAVPERPFAPPAPAAVSTPAAEPPASLAP